MAFKLSNFTQEKPRRGGVQYAAFSVNGVLNFNGAAVDNLFDPIFNSARLFVDYDDNVIAFELLMGEKINGETLKISRKGNGGGACFSLGFIANHFPSRQRFAVERKTIDGRTFILVDAKTSI